MHDGDIMGGDLAMENQELDAVIFPALLFICQHIIFNSLTVFDRSLAGVSLESP